MINVGDTVEIVKGCRKLSIAKGARFIVADIRPDGPDYGHTVSVVLKTPGTLARIRVQVRHQRRLDDAEVNAHKGDPTASIRFRRIA